MPWIKIFCTRHSDSTTYQPGLGATGTHMDVVKSEWPNSGWGVLRWYEQMEPRFVLHDKLTFQYVVLGTVIYSARYREPWCESAVSKEKCWPQAWANPTYHRTIMIMGYFPPHLWVMPSGKDAKINSGRHLVDKILNIWIWLCVFLLARQRVYGADQCPMLATLSALPDGAIKPFILSPSLFTP